MKKISMVVAGTTALLLAAAPFAAADTQGQADQNNGQHCGKDSTLTSLQDLVLFSIAQNHSNDTTCTQDDGSGGEHHKHNDTHRTKHQN